MHQSPRVFGGDLHRFSPPISAIKVFLNAAQITHSQQLSISKGENKFLFCGLASSIEANNIILEKYGQAKLFKLSLITINDTTDIFSLEPEIVQLMNMKKDSLLSIENRIHKIRAEIEGLELQKAFLNKNANSISSDQNPASSKMNSASLMDTYASIVTGILDKKKELEALLMSRRSLLNLVFGITNSARNSSNINLIYVDLHNDADEYSTALSISYLSAEAAWNPVYEVFASEYNRIKLNYNAKVLNNTGINWDNINLTLSTADPFIYYKAPYLSPIYVGKFRTNPNYLKDNNNNSNKGIKIMKVPDREISFSVSGRNSFPSNPQAYLLNINVFELHPVLVYRTVPKKDANVYMVARVPDWEKLDLIDGEAALFSNGEFLGKTMIIPSETEDSLEIPLGIVKNIIVSYKLISEYSSKKILGGDLVSTYSYEIKIKNNDKSTITLEVLDQVPVSEESSVKTEINEMTEGADRDLLTGLIVWKKEIQAMSELNFTLKYSVSYPKRGGYGIPKENYSYRNARFL